MVKKIKRKYKIFILLGILLVISLVLFLFSIFYNPNKVLEEKEIIAKLMIGEPAGFDVNGSALIFGRLPPMTSANRKIILTNDYEFPIVAEFSIYGNISDFLIFNYPVYLDIGERENVTVSTIQIPKDAIYGNYSGTFVVVFRKA